MKFTRMRGINLYCFSDINLIGLCYPVSLFFLVFLSIKIEYTYFTLKYIFGLGIALFEKQLQFPLIVKLNIN